LDFQESLDFCSGNKKEGIIVSAQANRRSLDLVAQHAGPDGKMAIAGEQSRQG
jgi:hypothetical protein